MATEQLSVSDSPISFYALLEVYGLFRLSTDALSYIYRLNIWPKILPCLDYYCDTSFDRQDMINCNKQMLTKFSPYIARGKCFIAVGLAHCVGDHGFIRMLQQRGYKVEAVNETPAISLLSSMTSSKALMLAIRGSNSIATTIAKTNALKVVSAHELLYTTAQIYMNAPSIYLFPSWIKRSLFSNSITLSGIEPAINRTAMLTQYAQQGQRAATTFIDVDAPRSSISNKPGLNML